MPDSDNMDEMDDHELEAMDEVEKRANEDDERNSSKVSALRDNFKQKGHNSYYCAHKTVIDGPEWDCKEEPRKISTSSSLSDILNSRSSFDTITEYLWCDGDSSIKLYIDQTNASTISLVSSSSSSLFPCHPKTDNGAAWLQTSTTTSFEFRYNYENKTYSLSVPLLSDSIAGASFKKKNSKFIVTLTKESETKWTSLTKACL